MKKIDIYNTINKIIYQRIEEDKLMKKRELEIIIDEFKRITKNKQIILYNG